MIRARVANVEDILLTAIIPEKWSHDGKPREKVIKVIGGYNHAIDLPVGTKVFLPGNDTQYALVTEHMKNLPDPPQSDMIITLGAGIEVFEKDRLPYGLGVETKAKLPETCKFFLHNDTKLQGPNGLLTLTSEKGKTEVKLVPRVKPMTDIKSPDIATPKEEIKLPDWIMHQYKLNDLANRIISCAKSGYLDGPVNSFIKLAISEYLRNVFGISIP